MSESKRIKTALVSVYHKDGLDAIIRRLAEEGVEFLSTGGTRHFIESLGYACHAVEDLTGYPSILGVSRHFTRKYSVVFCAVVNWKKTVSRLPNMKFLK
jgi:AICAR transformylase/IMP cyclohydrolase PurH